MGKNIIHLLYHNRQPGMVVFRINGVIKLYCNLSLSFGRYDELCTSGAHILEVGYKTCLSFQFSGKWDRELQATYVCRCLLSSLVHMICWIQIECNNFIQLDPAIYSSVHSRIILCGNQQQVSSVVEHRTGMLEAMCSNPSWTNTRGFK